MDSRQSSRRQASRRRNEMRGHAEPAVRPARRRTVHQVDQKQEDRRANRSLLRRTIVLMVVFGILLFIPLWAQLWRIQIQEHDEWTQRAANSQTRDVAVGANRGSIYDASGRTLAISATTYNLILSPLDLVACVKQRAEDVTKKSDDYQRYRDAEGEVDDDKVQQVIEETRQEIVDFLSAQLGLDEEKLAARMLKTNSQYEKLAEYLEEEEVQPIRDFITKNKQVGMSAILTLTPTAKRYYPQSTVGSHIVGYMSQNETSGDEKVGTLGLEKVYNDELSGLAGRVVTAKTGRGFQMLSSYENYLDAEDGENLTLTMDASIQSLAEQLLQEGIAAYDVQNGGIAIVMNPSTGAVYAMASTPDYDPNDYDAIIDDTLRASLDAVEEKYGEDSQEYKDAVNDAYAKQWRNKALSDAYEPGSTFKPLIVAAALEEGVITMDDTFYCSGATEMGGHVIHCHKRAGHGSQTLTQVLENSCNCGMMEIASRLGAEKMWQYFDDYGLLSEKTGIDLYGEGESLFWDEDYFKSENGLSSLAVASFGQTFKVTPIRMITSFASVINGGHLIEPYLVDKVSGGDGSTISYHETQEVRQVLSEDTSEKLREMLESVVANGTGKNAYMAGYRIGGKTGTSEKRDEDTDDVVVSFMGFAPADNPQVLVLVALDSPKRSSPGSNYTASGVYISGGNMAAPICSQLIAETLDYLGVEKQYTSSELSGTDTVVPSLVGSDYASAEKALSEKGFACRVVGEGSAVTGQIPAGGLSIPGGSTVVLYMGEAVPQDQVEVPNVAGLTAAKVKEALESRGLFLRATGVNGDYSGDVTASSQSIDPGTKVSPGTVLEVRFVSSVIDYAYNT